jgi:hypothetical protein
MERIACHANDFCSRDDWVDNFQSGKHLSGVRLHLVNMFILAVFAAYKRTKSINVFSDFDYRRMVWKKKTIRYRKNSR